MHEVSALTIRLSVLYPFQNLKVSDVNTIARMGQVLRFRAGETIFHDGGSCAGLYVLLTGKIYLTKTGPQGQSSIISVIKPVTLFNEAAGLDGGLNPISAWASKESTAWQISHERVELLMIRYPKMGLNLLKVLAHQSRYLLSQCEDIAFRTTLGRTAKILLETSQNGKRTISRREYPNLELASKVATVPETFSRSIKTLSRKGYIQCSREQITVCEPHSLAELAEI
jgi:CRP-like cAMP-binding protein